MASVPKKISAEIDSFFYGHDKVLRKKIVKRDRMRARKLKMKGAISSL